MGEKSGKNECKMQKSEEKEEKTEEIYRKVLTKWIFPYTKSMNNWVYGKKYYVNEKSTIFKFKTEIGRC